jgi:hypothetical protein
MLEKAKATVELDGGEMEMYSMACWAMAFLQIGLGRFAEGKKWLVLWQKMKAAKRSFHESVSKELTDKYLGNEEKPASEGLTNQG